MTLAWNLLFYIENCMAVKWGNTVCTVIKWGSTVCSQVKWGSTVVYPDSYAVCFYSYGANPLSFDYGNSMVGLGTGGQHAPYANIANNNTNGTMTINSNNISLASGTHIYMTSPRNVAQDFHSCIKFKIVCNLNVEDPYGSANKYRILVAQINGSGFIGGGTTYTKLDMYITNTTNYTGGTYDVSVSGNTSLVRIALDVQGVSGKMTGTISEAVLYK